MAEPCSDVDDVDKAVDFDGRPYLFEQEYELRAPANCTSEIKSGSK